MPCGRATKKPRTFAGLQDSRSLPCLRWRGSSLYAESVRQRRRNNNSCGQQCERIESSHRGEPPFGFRSMSSDFHPNYGGTIGADTATIYRVFTMWTPVFVLDGDTGFIRCRRPAHTPITPTPRSFRVRFASDSASSHALFLVSSLVSFPLSAATKTPVRLRHAFPHTAMQHRRNRPAAISQPSVASRQSPTISYLWPYPQATAIPPR